MLTKNTFLIIWNFWLKKRKIDFCYFFHSKLYPKDLTSWGIIFENKIFLSWQTYYFILLGGYFQCISVLLKLFEFKKLVTYFAWSIQSSASPMIILCLSPSILSRMPPLTLARCCWQTRTTVESSSTMVTNFGPAAS